jgi:hypothetical protein
LALRHISRLWRAALVATLVVAALHEVRVWRRHAAAEAALLRRPAPAPLPDGDLDRDGLPDALEAALARRFAPIVILHPGDRVRPASIPWLLEKFGPPSAAQAGLPVALRAGSRDPRDWATYVHVYPRTDGDVNVQYWFFYAYNERPPFFDHDADWEHVTVRVTPGGQPRGVYFAQHWNCHPGVFRPWQSLRKDGDHPIVLSARGTHASYPDQESVVWLDAVSGCVRLQGCRDPIWRTAEAGGLVNVGERGQLLGSAGVRGALAFAGRWGGDGHFPGSRAAPHGPSHQPGFVSDGFR